MSLRLEQLRRAGSGNCALPSLAFCSAAEADVCRFAWGGMVHSAWSTVLCVSLALLPVSVSDVKILESYSLGQEKWLSWNRRFKDNVAVHVCPLWSLCCA